MINSNTLKIVDGFKHGDNKCLRTRNTARRQIIEIQGANTIAFKVGFPTELITGAIICLSVKLVYTVTRVAKVKASEKVIHLGAYRGPKSVNK